MVGIRIGGVTMPLDNNAKIGDIITALGDMQGINQKAELASVIGAPATASDNVATQITKIQDAKDVFAGKIGVPNITPLQAMADGLVVGKKWASGTILCSSDKSKISLLSNQSTTHDRYKVIVTGLKFKPSLIIIFMPTSPEAVTIYRYGHLSNFQPEQAFLSYMSSDNYSTSGFGYNATYTGFYVNSTGFSLPSPADTSNASHFWIAYE